MIERALLVAVAAIATIVSGCGGSEPAAGERCVRIVATDGTTFAAPPPPHIRARLDGQRIVVDYEAPDTAGECEAAAIRVTARSAADRGNMAPPEHGEGAVPLAGSTGTVRLRLPALDLPPYEALASVYTDRGVRSEVTIVAVPQPGEYCLRHHPLSVCRAQAQRKYFRCLAGRAPRAACPDWIYGVQPPVPVRAVRGVTRAELARSFIAAAMRSEGGSGVTFVKAGCASLVACTATWRSDLLGGRFRSRFLLSDDRHRVGCWNTARRVILEEPPDRAGWTPFRYVVTDRLAGCAHWPAPASG